MRLRAPEGGVGTWTEPSRSAWGTGADRPRGSVVPGEGAFAEGVKEPPGTPGLQAIRGGEAMTKAVVVTRCLPAAWLLSRAVLG
jgi:hypothetical protein